MSAAVLSTFERLAPEILERIAYYVVTDTFLGPPSHLLPLLCISSTVYRALSLQNNTLLYANIFRFKFDDEAPTRRLSDRWLTTKCLSQELVNRCLVLKRIRNGHPHSVVDLWTAYLMMLEGDGRNESQLIDWAGIIQYLYLVISHRTSAAPTSGFSWFREPEGTALTIWLLFMTVGRDSLAMENPHWMRSIQGFLFPFVVGGHHFPSTYAPDAHFELPLCPNMESAAPSTSGPHPRTVIIRHYSHPLTISTPIITNAAILAFQVRAEARVDVSSSPGPDVPANREAANAAGFRGATVEDIQEFHTSTRTQFLTRCPLVLDQDGDDNCKLATGSRRHDHDWCRLVSCHSPWAEETALRGAVHEPGALSGCWRGREIIPDLAAYVNMIRDPSTVLPRPISLQNRPLYFRLREHHCFNPDTPLSPGSDAWSWGNDILNSWLPQGMEIIYEEEAIVVFDPTTDEHIRYETFFPDREGRYSRSACERLQVASEDGEMSDDEDHHTCSRSGSGAESELEIVDDHDRGRADNVGIDTQTSDDDDEWEDETTHISSGVCDILITGETIERHGEAWGHHKFIGRIRPWDGLIVLLRTSRHPGAEFHSKWIFKGYLHDENLVGRWRETSTQIGMVGFQGGFVFGRMNEEG